MARLDSIAKAVAYDNVFVSPHHDDLALSCAGIALGKRGRGERSLAITVFVGRPAGGATTEFAAFQHERWGGPEDPWEARRAEEREVMEELGIDYVWLDYLDAIYRGSQYLSDEDLFGPIKTADLSVQRALSNDLVALRRRNPRATIYVPLGVGAHVDHQLCHLAADSLVAAGIDVAYYEDIPYAISSGAVDARVRALGGRLRPEIVEIGSLIEAKIGLVETYRSQTSWIFRHYGSASQALRRQAAALSKSPGGYAERVWIPAASAGIQTQLGV